MRVLLITPPMLQMNAPYPATPFLAGFLRQRGVEVVQDDLSLRLILRLFSRDGIGKIENDLRLGAGRLASASPSVRHFLAFAAEYRATVDSVVAFLQGRDPALALRIATRRWLPEGPRFSALDKLRWICRTPRATSPAPPKDGSRQLSDTHDWARHLASLYLDDLADAIRDGVDARFEFARYAEKLAAAAADFAPLLEALRAKPTLVDRFLDELAGAAIRRHAPDLVAVTAPFPGNVYGAFRIAGMARAMRPAVRTALGGGYASTELRELADPRAFDFFDFVILDSGETPLLRLVGRLARRQPASRLVRTFVRERGAVRYRNDPAARDVPHAKRAAPVYDGLPLDQYIPMKESLNPMHSLWSDTRWNKLVLAHGCYWRRCAFCDTCLDYVGRYDSAPPEKVLRWMDAVAERTGRTGFHFVDEAIPPALLRKLGRRLVEGRRPFTWWGNIRFEKAFTPELAELMARSGCVAVTGALETASDRTLQLMQKGITVAQAARATHSLSRAGILVHAYLMYGFPTQTELETVNALEYVRQLFAAGAIHSAYWHRFALTVHSPMASQPGRFGIRIPAIPRAQFARNEIPFEDLTSCNPGRFGAGLRKAAYNFMHGIGLNEDVRVWFDFHVPKPALPRRFVARVIAAKA